MECGREPGGNNTSELGVCIAATDIDQDGLNDGKCSGRICWGVAGTLCGGKVQGTFATKLDTCLTCEFFEKVKKEEGNRFQRFFKKYKIK